jgi:hypothetical protein
MPTDSRFSRKPAIEIGAKFDVVSI